MAIGVHPLIHTFIILLIHLTAYKVAAIVTAGERIAAGAKCGV